MSTLLGNAPNSGGANLFNLFSAFDYYLSVGLKPIFELSFMPASLADDPSKTIMHYKGIPSTFAADMAGAWGKFIAGVFTGLEARYGAEEVRTWQVEVWSALRGRAGRRSGGAAARAFL